MEYVAIGHATSPRVSVYPWSGSGFGTKFSDPATVPTGDGNGVAFSPDGATLSVGHGSSPFISNYPFSTSGIGVKYSNPASLPDGVGRAVAFSPNNQDLALAHGISTFITVYHWDASLGFGTKYSNPGTLPAGQGFGVAFSPTGNALVVAHATSPFVSAYPWTEGAGFGTRFSDPATLPAGQGNGVAFSPAGDAVAIAHVTSPRISIYPWSGSGFGTKFSDPATVPTGDGNAVAFNGAGDAVAVAHSISPFISVYSWSGAGFGTKFSDPGTLPPNAGRGVAFNPAGDAIVLAHSDSPFVSAYAWSGSGFGTKFSDPGTLPAGIGRSVAFTEILPPSAEGSSTVSGGGAVVTVGVRPSSFTSEVSGGGAVVSTGRARYREASAVAGGGAVTSAGSKVGQSVSAVSSGGSVVAAGVVLTAVEQGFVLTSGHVLEQGFVLDAAFLQDIEQGFVLTSDLRGELEQGFVLTSDIENTDTLEQGFVLTAPLLSGVPEVITAAPAITIRGQEIPFEEGTVSSGEGQFVWTCQITLADPAHYGLFQPDDAFTVHLPGEDFDFIVDSISIDRSSQVDAAARISGIGPGALFASPRAQKVSRTWDAAVLVTDIVDELFGAGLVQWGIINWTLPAFRYGVEDQAPMDVLQRLAQAAGGMVQSDSDGALRVRYLYPVSVPHYAGSTPDQEYADDSQAFSAGARAISAQLVNRLRILDVEPSATRDSVEFEQDQTDFTRGRLKVFPQPWRDQVVVEHTSNSQVSAAVVGVETEELTETVEVIAGKGGVSRPIHEIVSLEWLFVNLTGVAFEADAAEFSTTHPTLKESLLRITYRTRYLAFDAAAFPDAEVQFLVREAA